MASRRAPLGPRGAVAGGLSSTTAQECDRCQGDSEGSLMFPCGRQVTLCIACTTMFTDFLQGRLHGQPGEQLAPPSTSRPASGPRGLPSRPGPRGLPSDRPSAAAGQSSSRRPPDSSPGPLPSAHQAAAKTGREGRPRPASVSPIESHLERAAVLNRSPQRQRMGSEVGALAPDAHRLQLFWCFTVRVCFALYWRTCRRLILCAGDLGSGKTGKRETG